MQPPIFLHFSMTPSHFRCRRTLWMPLIFSNAVCDMRVHPWQAYCRAARGAGEGIEHGIQGDEAKKDEAA